MENREDVIENRRRVDLLNDHDRLTELWIQHGNIASAMEDHEKRMRDLEKQQVSWSGEIRGLVKVVAISVFLFNIFFTIVMTLWSLSKGSSHA